MGYKNVSFWRKYEGKKAKVTFRKGMFIVVKPSYSVTIYQKGVSIQFPIWASDSIVALNNTYNDFQRFCLEEACSYAECYQKAVQFGVGSVPVEEKNIRSSIEGLEVEFV